MAEVGLQAEVREGRGKGAARRLRSTGKVPATMYGRGADPMALVVDARALAQTLSTDAGLNVLIDLQVDGESHLTLAREIARNPVRGNILHVDFLKISKDTKIQVEVPVHLEGEAPGTKEGGVLEHHLWHFSVECLPTDVPDSLTVDISNVRVGDSVRVGDVATTEGIRILQDPDEVILTCIVPQLRTEPELEEAAVEGEEAVVAAEGEAAPEAAAEGGEAEGQSEED